MVETITNLITKICKKCGLEKNLDQFYISKTNSDGRWGSCILCDREKSKLYNKNHKESCAKSNKNWRNNLGIYNSWAYSSIQNHKQRGYIILFETFELVEKAKNSILCSLCRIQLDWNANKRFSNKNSPTLENINLKKELKIEDIEIACRSCNTTKGPRTKQEFINYCKNIYLRHSQKGLKND